MSADNSSSPSPRFTPPIDWRKVLAIGALIVTLLLALCSLGVYFWPKPATGVMPTLAVSVAQATETQPAPATQAVVETSVPTAQPTSTAAPTWTPTPLVGTLATEVGPTPGPVNPTPGTVTAVYTFSVVSKLDYGWAYTPGTTKTTPELRDDADSTGNGKVVSYDVGVNAGEFGIVTGWSVVIGGKQFGTGKDGGCALVTLTPGYYRNVVISSGRFEIYRLPDSNPLDPTGWSKVLATQAAEKEHQLYGCPSKSLEVIPMAFSSEILPLAP